MYNIIYHMYHICIHLSFPETAFPSAISGREVPAQRPPAPAGNNDNMYYYYYYYYHYYHYYYYSHPYIHRSRRTQQLFAAPELAATRPGGRAASWRRSGQESQSPPPRAGGGVASAEVAGWQRQRRSPRSQRVGARKTCRLRPRRTASFARTSSHSSWRSSTRRAAWSGYSGVGPSVASELASATSPSRSVHRRGAHTGTQVRLAVVISICPSVQLCMYLCADREARARPRKFVLPQEMDMGKWISEDRPPLGIVSVARVPSDVSGSARRWRTLVYGEHPRGAKGLALRGTAAALAKSLTTPTAPSRYQPRCMTCSRSSSSSTRGSSNVSYIGAMRTPSSARPTLDASKTGE